MKCLVADPKPDCLALLKSLALPNLKITPAKDVPTALRLYESLQPELVLLDFNLPYPGALNAIQEIRRSSLRKKRNPIIIAFTRNVSAQLVEQARQQGADSLVLKPCSQETLHKQIQRLLPELFS